MRAIILSLLVLSAAGMGPQPYSVDPVDPQTSSVVVPPTPSFSLSLTALNGYFANMTAPEARVVKACGDAGVALQVQKPTDVTFTAKFFICDAAGTYISVLYTHDYSWVKKANSLVSLECNLTPPTFPEVPPPEMVIPIIDIIPSCERGVELATNIIESVLSSPVNDFDASGYAQMVQCLRQKITIWASTIVQTCFFKTLDDTTLVRERMSEQIRVMEQQGYVCNNGSCYKTTQTFSSTTTITATSPGGMTGLARSYTCASCAKRGRAAPAEAEKSLANAYLEDFGSL